MLKPAFFTPRSASVARGEHHLFLIWLLFTGVLAFSLFVVWQQGILHTLYHTDRSNLSMVITFIYFLVTVHCAIRAWTISRESSLSQKLQQLVRESAQQPRQQALPQLAEQLDRGGDRSASLIGQYLSDLKIRHGKQVQPEDHTGGDLLDVYVEKLKGPQEIGWFATDIMLKLGLLGTIIGFIMMLGSVTGVTDFDVSAMQNILQLMSSGMGTALYTTMTGLICSMLAAAQYYLLDRGADEILGNLQHLTEVHLLPGLAATR